MALGSFVPTPYHRCVRPTACPRCARASATWTFERDQGLAGCPCGEVVPYTFDDAPIKELSMTPTKPRAWVEDARTNGFVAMLKPSVNWLSLTLALALGLVIVGPQVLHGGPPVEMGGVLIIALEAAALVAGLGLVTYRGARQSTFAIEGGRFRAEAKGHHTEVALEDVQRFFVVAASAKTTRRSVYASAPFELVVGRTNGEKVRVPLFVATPHEAQFIADRANALLATDGRTIDCDYRGRHLRVRGSDREVAPPVRVETGPLPEAIDDRDEPEKRRQRMQRK